MKGARYIRVLTVALAGVMSLSPGFAAGKRKAADQAEGFVNVDGTRLYYVRMGRGTPILVLHGGPGLNHSYLLPGMRGLSKDHTLYFIDQRGQGRSSADVDSTAMTLNNFVKDVEGVRRALHLGKLNLLAHSWGGLVAMVYAVEHPENLRSLILLNPAPATSAERDEIEQSIRSRISARDSAELTAIRSTKAFRNADPDTLARYFRITFRCLFCNPSLADSVVLYLGNDYAGRSKLLGYLNSDPEVRSYDLRAALRSVRCPVLIVGGDHDQIPLSDLEEIHRNLKKSRLVILKRCGHFPFVETPDELFHAIRAFLSRL